MKTFLPEDFNSLIQLMEYFSDEKDCIRYLQHRRWNGKPVCPHCGHEEAYSFSDGIRFKCKDCKRQFTVKVGTFFENSKLPLRKWFIAAYLLTSHKKGISSYQLAKDIDIGQRSAWFLLQRLRHALGIENDSEEQLEGVVESDETFVGGKNKNRHKDKKIPKSQGRSFKDKTPILGLMQRGEGVKKSNGKTKWDKISKVKAIVIPDTSGDTIKPVIDKVVKKGSVLMTDEWTAYNGMNKDYDHRIVNHGARQYVSGDTYTNTVEGFWTGVKRSYVGIYHVLSRKHLQRYADEFAFRYNTRDMSEGARFDFAMSLKAGPLKYKELIGNFG